MFEVIRNEPLTVFFFVYLVLLTIIDNGFKIEEVSDL